MNYDREALLRAAEAQETAFLVMENRGGADGESLDDALLTVFSGRVSLGELREMKRALLKTLGRHDEALADALESFQ